MKILTWHVHGSYLYYLVHSHQEFFLPIKPGRPEGYGGCAAGFRWPPNVHDVPTEDVRDLRLDAILFQSSKNYLVDQYEILSEEQRRLPRIYLEHDPPRESPIDTPHPVDDPDVLLVHVTHFNRLMWNNRRTPTRVIEHGVLAPDSVSYTGELERGLVIVNDISKRKRRVGLDVFEQVRTQVPLDLIGMGSKELGGLGEIGHDELPAFMSHYRFFFNPIRYTSLGLAVCEAMMLGMPIIGLATTEMVRTVENGVSGYVDTNLEVLIERMQELLMDQTMARRLSAGAQRFARDRFAIDRFAKEWDNLFAEACRSPNLP